MSRADGTAARGPWVVARSALRFRCISLVGLSAADRQGALQAQMSAWQPFPESVYLVDRLGDYAQVFAIDRAALDAAGADARQVLWPESVLHESGADGLRLVACLEGFEGQAWSAGVLKLSRWWSALPDAQEWQAFVRQSRIGAAQIDVLPDVSEPIHLAWLKPTRTVLRAEHLGRAEFGNERLLVGALALILMAFTGLTAREAFDAHAVSVEMQAALESLRQEVAPVLAARDKALAAADESAALIKQLHAPQPLEVMDELAKLLPKGSLVKELDLNAGTMRVALDLPADVSRAKVVSELESGGWFTQVSEVKDGMPRSGVSLEMKLRSTRPPATPGNDAGLTRRAAEPRSALPAGWEPTSGTPPLQKAGKP